MFDAIVGTTWLVINVACCDVLFKVANRLFPRDVWWQHLQQMLILFWSWCVLTCTVLSLLGVLSGATLMAVNLVALVIARLWLRRSKFLELSDAPPAKPSSDHPWLSRIWLGSMALIGALALQFSLLQFPMHWDALMYHIPLVDEWLQNRSLWAPGCPVWYNPGNFEVLGLWIVAPLSGDFWISLSGVIPVGLLGLATLQLGWQWNWRPVVTGAVLFAVLGSDVVFGQAISMENDVAVVATWATVLGYGLRWIRTPSRASLLIASCALGLLTGIKYYALGYVVVVLVVLVVACGIVRGFRAGVALSAGMLCATIILAGYWYARNSFVTGTPLYPLGFSTQTDVLASLRPGAFGSSLLGNGNPMLWLKYVNVLQRTCCWIQWGCVLLFPLLLGGTILRGVCATLMHSVFAAEATAVTSTKTKSRETVTRSTPKIARSSQVALLSFCLAVLLILSFFVFSITPFVVNPRENAELARDWRVVRFSLCPLWIAVVTFGSLMNDLSRVVSRDNGWKKKLIWSVLQVPAIIVAGGALFQFATVTWLVCRRYSGTTWQDWSTFVVLAIDLLLIVAVVRVAFAPTRNTTVRPVIVTAVVVLLFGSLTAFNSERWHRDFSHHFDAKFKTTLFSQLCAMTPPARSIGAMLYRVFPLYGSHREFHLTRPLKISSRDSFEEFLRSRPIDVLCVIPDDYHRFGRYHNVGQWAEETRETLLPLDHSDYCYAYRVDREKLVRKMNVSANDQRVLERIVGKAAVATR